MRDRICSVLDNTARAGEDDILSLYCRALVRLVDICDKDVRQTVHRKFSLILGSPMAAWGGTHYLNLCAVHVHFPISNEIEPSPCK